MASTTYTKILYAGTYAQYKALVTAGTVDETHLYFCTDNGKLYRGSVDFTDSFVPGLASATPAAADAVPGKIYYETDTKKFKTLINNALVEIGNPIDAMGDSTTSTITVSSSDEHVPSSKNVWTYGQEILAQATGGSAVVKDVANDATTDAGIIVTKGDDSTASVVVSGVVTTPTWDSTNLRLTLPVAGGQSVEVNIPKDIFLESGSYDVTNKQIVLVLNDPESTEIRFDVEDLIPIYVAKDTTTVDTTVAFNATTGQYEISGDFNVSDSTGNVLVVEADGLFVDGSQYATTTQLNDLEGSHNNLAAAALEWGTFA